jgi:hypothetical protein
MTDQSKAPAPQVFAHQNARTHAHARCGVSKHSETITAGQAAIEVHAPSRVPAKPRRECGAHARSTGKPCQRPALANGRCVNHGGLSTGPKTAKGRARIAEATRRRWTQFRCEIVVGD